MYFTLNIVLLFDVFSSGDSWLPLLNRFAASVRHITGQELEVQATLDGHGSIVSEELDILRNKVDELSGEVDLRRGISTTEA